MKRAEFTLIPMGNRFRYRIRGKVFCTEEKRELQKSQSRRLGWGYFFDSKIEYEKFLKKNRPIKKVMMLSNTMYLGCDIII